MAIESIYSSSMKMRITGMSSGWDTDQLVQAMTLNEKNRVTKAYQSVAKMEFKREAYKGINSLVTKFNNTFLSVAGEKSIKATTAFRAYSVKMNDNNAVKITANNSAELGNYSVSVQNVAKGASLRSAKQVDTSFNLNTKLSDVGLNFVADGENSDINLKLKNGSKEIDIVLNSNDTIGTLVSKINSADLGITAKVSEISGEFTITTKETGAAASMSLVEESHDATGSAVNVFSILGFDISSPVAGEDAQYKINGYTHTSSTNKISIDGLNIELLEETGENAINFSVQKDTTTAMTAIKDFVENLNTLYQTLHQLVNEKQYRDYQPLTLDERSELSESDAAKWDAKAKSGIVRGEAMIESLMTEIRMGFLQKVPGTDLTFADIGITTNKLKDRETGEGPSWIIDDAKLQKALEENPVAVEQLFIKDTFAEENRYADSGIAARLTIALSNFETKIRETEYRDNDFEKRISDLNTIMARANVKFAAKQEAAYAKLAAMETALSKLQSQSSWLSSQLGG